MTERLVLNDLQPGDTLKFTGFHELYEFENMVVQKIDPAVSVEWSGRKALRDIVKSPKFNGSFTNITLQVMADPRTRDC